MFIDYRGHHRKGVAIYNNNLVNLQQKPWFHRTKNVFLNTTGSKNIKSYNSHYFSYEFFSDQVFRDAPCMLMLVLHKDVLFHCGR